MAGAEPEYGSIMKLELLDELEHQHREVESLLRMLLAADSADDQRAVLERLVDAMSEHMEIEESAVHPELAHIDGILVEEAEIEHDWARHHLRQLSDLIGQPGFGAAVTTVAEGIACHVDDEETEAFPKLRQVMTDAEHVSTRPKVEADNTRSEPARA